MAASTSYNQIPSSSTSPPTLYDVFLSFRGVDTRYSFTSHLYKHLCSTGIRTFMDNPELRSGEVISDSLIQAIQESKTYIVVLSENYASSSWCLDELVEILNCYKTMKRLVIPVFCNIDSSVARHQTGSFKEAFGKHQTRFNMDKVNKWRLALREVAGFSGYPISENRSQADIIDKVVDRVLHEISPVTLDVAKYPVGLDSHVKSITALFKNHKEGVIRIGIHGMGGVGKTTIAKAVYNQNYQRFQGSCFLANVREVSGMRNGLESLQQKLIADVLKRNNFNIGNVDQGIELIRARICSRKVLIVIDDLDDPKPLEYLQGSFALGSMVIITTRNEDLLDRINVKSKYKVNHLDKYESRQLFARHAFGNDKISGTFTELSKEILERAGGLPLALKVFGSNLLNQPEEEWRWFIDKLNRVPIDDIEKKLVISFDALKSIDPVLQNIFLDIACFYIGWKREEVSKIMETCYTFVRRNIDILRKRCLLTINDSDELGMHDLLRDMGMKIARNNSPDEPGKYSRLWDSNDIYSILKNDKGTEAIQGIIFSELKYDHLHKWQGTEAIQGSIVSFAAQSFRRMSKLRFLSLIRVHLSGSFKHIFEDLRWLHWTDFPSFCLPSDFHPEKLVILELPCSRMRMMFELHKACPVFEKLKILNMSDSLNLISTPDFSRLPCLETLDLRGCSSLAEVHISIGSLVRLVSLDLRGCRSLKRIPDSICSLRALEVLAITSCTNLIALPVEVGKVKSLKNLNAARLNISKLPDSVGLLGNVVELRLFQSKNLETLPESISNLRSLEILDICDCMNLKEFPDQLGMITSLRELNARKATLLKRLPNLSNLKQLESLELTQCSALTEILGLEKLNSLKILKLSGCNSSLVAYTLTKRLLQIFSGFGHRMIIYIEPTGFPDWISRSSNSDFPSMASHDILAMIFCFKLSKYLYEIDYSVKNITSDFRWSESLSMPHGFDSVVMFIVPRSIFSIRDGDYGVELTSNLKIIHGIHLLYEPEITVVGESSSTTVNVEDERCYPCKRLKHSESDKNWHSLPLSSSHEIPWIDGNYSVVGYLQQQMEGAGPSRGRSNIKTVTSLLRRDGSWADSCVLFPVPPLIIDPEAYFASKDKYYQENHIDPPQFDSANLDSEWGKYNHLKHRSSFQYSKWKDFLSKAFQIGGDYCWRAPTPSERLYSRPDDGAIVMPLEHLKAGLTPKPHKFLVALFKQQFKCTPAQFTPNSIRLILWFIAACDQSSRQPTFEAFFAIFSVKRSNCAPFYEVVQGNKNSRIGLLAGGHEPVKLATTMQHWQYEYVIICGGDWSYMPGFSSKVKPQCVIRRDKLTDNQVKNCADLLHAFGFVWDETEFQTVSKLKFYGLYPPASMDMPELAWGKDRKKIEELLKNRPPKPEHLIKQVDGEVEKEHVSVGEDDDVDMEDKEVEGGDAELDGEDEEVFEPRLGDHERVPVDVGDGVDLIGSCPVHVGTNTIETAKHRENETTKEWVEGHNPVNLNTVFADCSLMDDDFFVEGLDRGNAAPAEETLVADDEETLMNTGVSGRAEGAIDEDIGGVRRVPRARPKILVSCSRLGMKRRTGSQWVLDSTFEYDASSDDEIVDPSTGEQRNGVGYLFSTAPKAVLPEMLTLDDRGKLAKATKKKKIIKFEKYYARVGGYGAGLVDELLREGKRRKVAERQVKTLRQENGGLIADMDLLQEEAEEGFVADRKRLEDQVREVVDDANRAKEKLEVAGTKLTDAKARIRLLEERLAAMPSAADTVQDYKASPAYKKDFDDAIAAFRATSGFREIVGAESRKMAPLIVACCREFFRDDLRRPKDDFEYFFVEWMKTQKEAHARRKAHPPP